MTTSRQEKKREWWATLSPEQRQAINDRTAEGRRKSPHWNGALRDSIPRGIYRSAGLPDDEIDYLMTLTGPERKAARLRMRDYGLTPTQFRDLLAAQEGKCALCDAPLTGRIDVDHDHGAGRVRGLLCRGCNLALGHLEGRGREWTLRALTWVEATSGSGIAQSQTATRPDGRPD